MIKYQNVSKSVILNNNLNLTYIDKINSIIYTSDYDLSTFDAHQYGFGVNYTDIFTASKIWKFGIKNIDFRYNHYSRSDGLEANIVSFGIKFVLDK